MDEQYARGALRLKQKTAKTCYNTKPSDEAPTFTQPIEKTWAARAKQAKPSLLLSNLGRPLPTPPATRSVEAASAREAEKAMEEGPHGRQNRPKRTLKLLGTFGNSGQNLGDLKMYWFVPRLFLSPTHCGLWSACRSGRDIRGLLWQA